MHTVALAGYGRWGRNLARNLDELGALRAVCDPDPDARAAAGAALPGVEVRERLDDVEADAVVLATPAATHADLALRELEAGRDVFVEKPLALRLEEGARVAERAASGGRVLMVGHILEYHPAVVALRDLVASGELGTVRYLYSHRLNLGRVRTEENILWSFAPHDLSVITGLVGRDPVTVATSGGAYLQEGIADVTVTSMAFPDDVRAHVFVSWLHPFKEQRLVVVGDRRMAVFSDTEGTLTLHDKGIDLEDGVPVARTAPGEPVPFDPIEPMRAECEHFLARLEDRAAPRTDAANGLRVLRLLEASQASLDRGGAVVSMDEVTV